jgi:MFS family permease
MNESTEATATGAPTAAPARRGAGFPGLTAILTAAMALALLLLFTIGALGPFIVRDLGLSRSGLGLLVTVAFTTATLLSLIAGHMVDLVGGRRALAGLLLLVMADLVLVSLSPTYPVLLGTVALAGIAIALANPATNKLVSAHVPAYRRGVAIGVKQSGVQIGAFAAGLALPGLATALEWRGALRLTALVPLAAFAIALWIVPADPPARERGTAAAPGSAYSPHPLAHGVLAVHRCRDRRD